MIDTQHETIYWLGLRLEVPCDWQIVRHGLSSARGRLTFTDRFAERLDLSWRHLDHDPDVEHMVRDQRARDDRELPDCQTADVRISGWHGYQRSGAGESLVRAARYDAAAHRLLEALLIIEPKQGRSTKVTEQLLNAVRSVAAENHRQRLRAFDIDVTLPENLRLSRASVEPANIVFEFEDTDKKHPDRARVLASVVVRRMGMASSWYRGNALRLIERESPRIRFGPMRDICVNSHVAGYAEGDASRARVLRWLGRGMSRRALLWHCEAENAVYHVATTSYDRAPLHPEALQLECCKGGPG
jgi:hypothetical protein